MKDGRNNKLLPHGELVEDDQASGIGWIEHPQRSYNRQAGVECLVRVFLKERGHRFLPQACQSLRYLENGIVRVFARQMGESYDGEEGGQLQPSDVQFFVGQVHLEVVVRIVVGHWEGNVPANRARHDERVTEYPVGENRRYDGLDRLPRGGEWGKGDEDRGSWPGNRPRDADHRHGSQNRFREYRFVVVRVDQRLAAFVVVRHVLSRSQIEVERVHVILGDQTFELGLKPRKSFIVRNVENAYAVTLLVPVQQ